MTPKLIANILDVKLKGVKLRITGDEEFVVVPMDYKVPADYKSGELISSSFTKKGKQAHKLVTKILIPKTGSVCSCLKFEWVMVYAIIKGMQIN